MMELNTVLFFALLFINLILTVWLIFRKDKSESRGASDKLESLLLSLKADLVSDQMKGLVSIRESLDSANKVINQRLADGTGSMNKRMEIIGEIDNKLGQLHVQTKSIEQIGKNIQSLSELLKPPKLRGNLGETFLENLLKDILPDSLVSIQHSFKDGQRVDAAVNLANRLMPIDSKFPLESFQRLTDIKDDDARRESAQKDFNAAIKKHIDDISKKYIRPAEGTTEFAVMYIPSEAIYGYFISSELTNGFDYAMSKRVIPSSPGHLYGFLASIKAIYSEAGIDRDNNRLVESVRSIKTSLEKLIVINEKMNGSLRKVSGNLDKSRDELNKMTSEMESIFDQ